MKLFILVLFCGHHTAVAIPTLTVFLEAHHPSSSRAPVHAVVRAEGVQHLLLDDVHQQLAGLPDAAGPPKPAPRSGSSTPGGGGRCERDRSGSRGGAAAGGRGGGALAPQLGRSRKPGGRLAVAPLLLPLPNEQHIQLVVRVLRRERSFKLHRSSA
jgi:hypothetical protein